MLPPLYQKYTAKQLLLGGFFLPLLAGLVIYGAISLKNITLGNPGDGGVHIRGNKNAAVKLVEYSDFQCPFCGQFYPTMKRLLAEYGDKVSLQYKHFPLSFHPNALPAAEASECAAEQGKFWEFHDLDFSNQAELSPAILPTWARSLGLNMTQFNTCFASGKYKAKIQAEYAEGAAHSVQGTPTTFINGTLLSGAVPYEQLKAAVDAALNKK